MWEIKYKFKQTFVQKRIYSKLNYKRLNLYFEANRIKD